MERGRPLIESLSQGLLRSGEGMPGRVWLQREYRWVDDIAHDPSLPCVGIAIKAGLQGALALPIELEKQMLGVVEFYAPRLPCPDATLLNTLYPVLLQVAQFIRRRWDEASLRLAKEAAEAANKAKSEFLSSISHEVRTPLHGIIGLTEILLSGELQDSQREYLRLVQSSSDTLLSLINDMLDFGKLEAARMTLEEVPFEIRPTLEANLKTFSVQAEQRGLIFRWHISPEVPGWLVGDPLRFQQVILNLVGNAIKFTPLGEVTLSLDVVARTSREVVLRGAVRDTGIGIPQDQLEAIFEAFRQVDGSRARRYGGTGLGLTIASRLIALMNGRIWVESSLGAGSTFHFTVCMGNTEPMPLPGNSANWEQPADWTATEQDPVVTGKRILVAEDNPVNRIVLQLILDRRGHQLLWANNGREAVRMYQESRIDLVLMDVQLPEMDGVEATREIIALSKQKQIKPWIVGLTAHASEDDRKRCLEAGMVRYITKPVQPADLLHALDDVFRATIVPGQGSPTS
jgi:signal transduction histidine kinase/ActR/RegA family two-component response regulator